MASANIVALQNGINRLAGMSVLPLFGPSFPRVSVDGGLGPKTNQGVLNALNWLQDHAMSASRSQAFDWSGTLADADNLQTAIAQHAGELAAYINGAADELGAAKQNTQPAPSSGGGVIPSVPLPPMLPGAGSGITARLSHFWSGLVTWQKIGLIAAAALLAMWGFDQRKSQLKLAKARK